MTHPNRALLVVLLVVLAGCSSSAAASVPPQSASAQPVASEQPPSSTAPSAPAGGSVTTPDEAAQLVIALDPRFAGLGPKNPDVIGACCFYLATATPDGFLVNIELGWGDCPSGCINHHRWAYSVAADGTPTLVSEAGDPAPSGLGGGGKGSY